MLIQSIKRHIFQRFVIPELPKKRFDIINYNEKIEQRRIFDLVKSVKQETDFLLTHTEAYLIYKMVRSTEKITGEMAEVGVYQGGSAKIIREADKNKELHLFDTFEGLPETSDKDFGLQSGSYKASYEYVKGYLEKYDKIYIYKGIFPSTAGPVKEKKFSFVNLDVDIYQATKDSLDFFYPRMAEGGVIMSHDYACEKGVKTAFDEFFVNKTEPIIELPGTQCLIVKV